MSHKFLLLFILVPMSVHAACPDGTTAYLGPAANLVRNANGECMELCGGGVTGLHTSNGYRFDLFATQGTFPAIHIKNGDTVCYADLISGQSDGTLNVSYNDAIYHANSNSGQLCPTTYTLSYSCGDGATGTPPESREIGWGELFSRPDGAAGCINPGYTFGGWKIDSTSLTTGTAYSYTYTSDKTMVATWTANAYGGAYLCNYCSDSTYVSSDYATGTYNSNFTPKATSSLSCVNPYGQTLEYYVVSDMFGDDTGEQLAPGKSTKWAWPGNVRLRAIWSDDGRQTSPEPPAQYTLSYSCGDGATGTPPESHTVRYKLYYTGPYRAGTCYKPGYYFSGWKIDSTSISKGGSYSYTYTTDKTMVAQWSANAYGAPYLCNYCSDSTYVSSDYATGTYNSNFTPKSSSSLSCVNPYGQTLQGYQVLDMYGNETGQTLTPGSSTTWAWGTNVRLRAIWSDDGRQTSPEPPAQYTLSYSCGDGATGTPPESHAVGYKMYYSGPYRAGTCYKPGYYFSGWKIDSTSISKGGSYSYTYTTDKTMVAQWTANVYGGAYICDNGTTVSSYINATFGGTITPSTTVCTAAAGTTFVGYKITDAFGNDTGITVASGGTYTWTEPGNIRLVAQWE
ncbi:MAG: hypothetical protein E7011_01735 [Alphaproteobacteria bacterium]|nr:hypothetical protein [Alphaproteobacteria bacterium]